MSLSPWATSACPCGRRPRASSGRSAGRCSRARASSTSCRRTSRTCRRCSADVYYCNFSVFQSLPDSWAIDQLFPIVPIHRLNEQPTRKRDLGRHLLRQRREGRPVRRQAGHQEDPGAPRAARGGALLPGVFLVGAYPGGAGRPAQTSSATPRRPRLGGRAGPLPRSTRWSGATTVKEVLATSSFDVEDLEKAMRRDVSGPSARTGWGVAEGQSLLKFYERGIEGYTYLE